MFFKESLQELYLEDKRPWLVGFSGGKDSIQVLRLTSQHAGDYACFEIYSPSDQPQGLRRGFAFMGS
jgi:3'-phosphoadenosine 5'-phosphosulfate sulfotransferase (PAPS reductase)/FAD synthetase